MEIFIYIYIYIEERQHGLSGLSASFDGGPAGHLGQPLAPESDPICIGSRNSASCNIKSIAECLADEIMKSYANSYAIKKLLRHLL